MNQPPDLSAVIPVHDASASIEALVDAFRNAEDLDVQVVLVDDGSTDGSAGLIDALAERDDQIVALHNSQNLGAGVARNSGFAAASGRYTIFFDADDILHPEALPTVVGALDRSGADLAMTPYHYQRSPVLPFDSMNPNDSLIWEEVTNGANLKVTTLANAPTLLEFSNYPWNKVVRTSRYREQDLRFGTTPVHNDILGHWLSLLSADKILLIDPVLCTHVVHRGAGNLTNRNQQVRLALFDALDEAYSLLEANSDFRQRYSHCYWSFVLRVSDWASSHVAPNYRGEFATRLREHLLRIDLREFISLRFTQSPLVAERLVDRLLA